MMVIECKANFVGKDGLQGQKISAQGNALGNHNRQVVGTPCFCPLGASFPFHTINPGRCPGLIAHWPYRPSEYKCTCET